MNLNGRGKLRILVTGGAGFIGSALVRHIIQDTKHYVINVDKLTYAGNLESLATVDMSDRYEFEQADICDADKMKELLEKYKPEFIMNLAAESHVDRSINGPGEFIQTNIFGTYTMLESARYYWQKLDSSSKHTFRFHHISTDEVYGDLEGPEGFFQEETRYAPSSPYSASKAGSDHLVKAWGRTYGLPIIVTNCSNNYGPYHFPEKLIPLIITNALRGLPLPVYGEGTQVRDWLFVEDHARALIEVITKGAAGQTYNIGGHNEKQNIEVIIGVCKLLDELQPSTFRGIRKYEELITFVKDRPGHDIRYAIDASKIQRDLNWVPKETFESGLRKTVEWYLANRNWWEKLLDGNLRRQP